jgi:glycosyltransferase involved in cell wall biosynthesis
MKPRQPISVIVPAGNRVDTIEDCLRSVRWADELIVVDSFSSDGTFEIAKKYADRVLRHEYGFSALQKNWAIPQASHAWVLIVDTDERVSASLREEIISVLESDAPHVGYRIPRLNYLFGEKVLGAGYYPDYQVRLFKRDLGRYELRHVHAHVLLDGSCGTLREPFVHFAHRTVDQTLRNLLILMTTWEAEERASVNNENGQMGFSFLWIDLLFRPFLAFILRYFRQGGWKGGYRGLVVSLIWSMYVSITYMKIWEKKLQLPESWWSESWKNEKV